MSVFQPLHPVIRSFALVGGFLGHWALMEAELNRAIGQALDLTGIQSAMLSASLQLQFKIHILRTVLGLTYTILSEDRKRFDDALSEIAALSRHRNMMAHQVFVPDSEGGGVTFMGVTARGKLDLPKTTWTIDMFESKYRRIDDLRGHINELAERLGGGLLKQLADVQYEPLRVLLDLSFDSP